jgi:hypothetical protein
MYSPTQFSYPTWIDRAICQRSLLALVMLGMALSWGSAFAQTSTSAVTTATPTSQVLELRFADFFRTPIGLKGLEITNKLQQAHGQQVRLVGYLVQQEKPVPGRFMFTARPVQMSEHADGEADDLPPATVMVYLDAQHKDWLVPHVRGLVALQGVLSVGRSQASDGRVSWVQLQLGPDAARHMNAVEMSTLVHKAQHRH